MKQWRRFWDSAVAVDLGQTHATKLNTPSQLFSDYILKKNNLKKN